MEPEQLYRQVGRVIETTPNFSGYAPLAQEHLLWLGRAHALVNASGDMSAIVELNVVLPKMQTGLRHEALNQIMLVLYRVLGSAELNAPPGVRGSFIPAGNSFDAFAAVTKVIQTATRDVMIVDPYMDETTLTDFGVSVSDGVSLRLLADTTSAKPSLAPAALRWNAQHGATKSLQVRLAPARTLHDRAIFVDATTAWLLTQSLKDFAKRSPAEIVRADDTAQLKIAAYEELWSNGSVVL